MGTLRKAVLWDRPDLLEHLLETFGDEALPASQRTILAEALNLGRPNVVRWLLELPSFDALDRHALTPLKSELKDSSSEHDYHALDLAVDKMQAESVEAMVAAVLRRAPRHSLELCLPIAFNRGETTVAKHDYGKETPLEGLIKRFLPSC